MAKSGSYSKRGGYTGGKPAAQMKPPAKLPAVVKYTSAAPGTHKKKSA